MSVCVSARTGSGALSAVVRDSASCEGCVGTGDPFVHAHDCFVRRLPRALDGQGFPSPGSEPGDLEAPLIADRSTFSEKTLFLITY